ncbi:MAG: phytanoyl-CoA dioxygenase family protein [Pirellulales bacterium]|nr:phytanoyl-CoA dioxygenase family protein [Pirellulales bacterium]
MNFSTDRDEPITNFQKDGYIFERGLFDSDEMAGLLHGAKSDEALAAESYARKDASGGATRLALRNELDDDSIYAAVVRSERVVSMMERLLGDEIYHYHHKMMIKEPRVGGAWEWHQDYGYWYNNGCLYPNMASCLIAVDRATRANGCLQVLRGSHLIGRIDHVKTGDQTGADPERVSAAAERHELVYCEMEPGDAIFFHANLLHCSDQNTSDEPRWSLICCYNTRHNDPLHRGGRHPNYLPLDRWPDERVTQVLRATGKEFGKSTFESS